MMKRDLKNQKTSLEEAFKNQENLQEQINSIQKEVNDLRKLVEEVILTPEFRDAMEKLSKINLDVLPPEVRQQIMKNPPQPEEKPKAKPKGKKP